MTELLYLEDSYLKEFKALVKETDEKEKWIVLDKTAFYPTGGGQPCDYGKIQTKNSESNVTKVKRQDDKIKHFLEGVIPKVGATVIGNIDWDRRYQLMRTHTALHMLSAVIWREYHAQVTGGNMEPLMGRLDFELESMSAELAKEIELKLNLEVEAARNITSRIIPRSEAEKIPDLIRTKVNLLPSQLKEIRIVEIKGLDLQADGGTHVKNTQEVGTIEIYKYKSKGRINKRLQIRLIE